MMTIDDIYDILRGGTHAAMAEVNAARDEGLKRAKQGA